jgi:hypothetical protein
MTKARDLANIISGGFTADDIPNLDAAKITSGTFADARIAASNVSQHATSFDDNKIVNDISTLALRQASNENKAAYNTNSMYVDVFQDATGITGLTNALRNSDEYVSSSTLASATQYLYSFESGTSNLGTASRTGITETSTFDSNGRSSTRAQFGSLSQFINNDGTKCLEISKTNLIQANDDYTVEWWFHNAGLDSGYSGMVGMGNSTNTYEFHGIYQLRAGLGGEFRYSFNNGGSGNTLIPNTSSTESSWRHYVIGRKNGTFAAYLDGSRFYTYNEGATAFDYLAVGKGFGIVAEADYFDSVLVSLNAAKYDFTQSSITVPTSQPTELQAATVNATGSFESNAITAPSSTSSMGAIITYQDNAGTNALNTDIVLKLSADGGSNYSTATMTALPDFSTGIKMAKVNDLAVTAGTQLKYKISFANQSNSKNARIRGVSLQY